MSKDCQGPQDRIFAVGHPANQLLIGRASLECNIELGEVLQDTYF